MTLLRLSPTDPLDLVRAWLPAGAWVTAAEMARRTGLKVAQVNKALAKMFDEREAMRRPGTWGREWKRINAARPQEKT